MHEKIGPLLKWMDVNDLSLKHHLHDFEWCIVSPVADLREYGSTPGGALFEIKVNKLKKGRNLASVSGFAS